MALDETYHLEELRIARDPTDPRHEVPAIEPSECVLDLGCGAGQIMIAICPEAVSYGLDIDFPSLKFGRTLSSRVRFCCGSAECLPYRSGAFDFVVSRGVLLYTNLNLTLSEMYRVTKPGGHVWLMAIPFRESLRFAKDAHNWRAWMRFGYVIANSLCFHFCQQMFPLPGRNYFESFQTEKSMRRAMEKCGFRNVSITRKNHLVVTAYKADESPTSNGNLSIKEAVRVP